MMQKDEAHQSSTLSCALLPTNYKLILVFNYFHNWSLSITIWMFVAWCFCPQPIPMPKNCSMLSWKICRNIHVPVLYFPNFQSTRINIKISKIGELKNGHKFFVWCVFATNASFLRVIADFQIYISIIGNIYHLIVDFLPKKSTIFAESLPQMCKLRKILILRQNTVC